MPQPTEAQISQLRQLIGDVGASNNTFEDAALEAALARTLDGVTLEMAVESDFDVYAAAVELLEMWAARTAGDVDFKDGQRMFSDSQASAGRLALAEKYRAQIKPRVGRLSTSDHHINYGYGNW